jgi:hypothetical protein
MWLNSKLSPAELFGRMQAAYEKAYAADGPWSPGSFHAATVGQLKADLGYDDRDGHHWQGTLTVEPVPGTHQFVVRLASARAS